MIVYILARYISGGADGGGSVLWWDIGVGGVGWECCVVDVVGIYRMDSYIQPTNPPTPLAHPPHHHQHPPRRPDHPLPPLPPLPPRTPLQSRRHPPRHLLPRRPAQHGKSLLMRHQRRVGRLADPVHATRRLWQSTIRFWVSTARKRMWLM